jgi:hypothetical protein
MMKRFMLFVALALAISAAAAADAPKRPAPQAIVEAVQMPAWVERGGARIPLAAGMPLQANDELRTGANARLLLKLAEGSLVKLGENAQLKFTAAQTRKDGVFVAAMNVLQGGVPLHYRCAGESPPTRDDHHRGHGHRRHPGH